MNLIVVGIIVGSRSLVKHALNEPPDSKSLSFASIESYMGEKKQESPQMGGGR